MRLQRAGSVRCSQFACAGWVGRCRTLTDVAETSASERRWRVERAAVCRSPCRCNVQLDCSSSHASVGAAAVVVSVRGNSPKTKPDCEPSASFFIFFYPFSFWFLRCLLLFFSSLLLSFYSCCSYVFRLGSATDIVQAPSFCTVVSAAGSQFCCEDLLPLSVFGVCCAPFPRPGGPTERKLHLGYGLNQRDRATCGFLQCQTNRKPGNKIDVRGFAPGAGDRRAVNKAPRRTSK